MPEKIHFSVWIKAATVITVCYLASVTAAPALKKSNVPCTINCNYNLFPLIKQNKAQDDDTVTVLSDTVKANKKQYTFSGNVRLRSADHIVKADNVQYNPQTKYSSIKGNIYYQNTNMQLTADHIYSNGLAKKATFHHSRYSIPDTQLNGKAKRITLLSNVRTHLTQGTISTCPVDSKIQDWHFESKRIDINHVSGWTRAYQATFKVRNKPIIYLPYVDFPIDKRRKTGILLPSLDYSNNEGLTINVPWYWNIQHNMDLLSDIYLIQKQGLWLSERFRHLGPSHYSKVYLEGIVQDRLYDDEDRYFVGIDHTGFISSPRLTYAINYNKTSDSDFFIDYDSNVYDDDTKYLDQEAWLKYTSDQWSAQIGVEAFQSLSDNEEKYRLLPRANLNWFPENRFGTTLRLNTEYSHFSHKDKGKVQGKRATLDIDLYKKFTNNYSEVTPGIHSRTTRYFSLINASSSSFQRQASTYYLGGKLFLDRNFTRKNNARWSQTLTPRFYYAYRKVEDEAVLPDFDSDAISLSYRNLFDHKIFSGKDRNGNLNRVSLGLETRLSNNQTDQTALEIRVGQGYDFTDKMKTKFAVEAKLNHRSWTADAKFYLSASTFETSKMTTSMEYSPADKKRLRLTYEYKRGNYEKLELSGRWKIKPQWQVFAKLEHSLFKDYSLENTLGIAYQNCCWETMVSVKREANDEDSTLSYKNKIELSFAFKGLSRRKIDEKIDNIIE